LLSYLEQLRTINNSFLANPTEPVVYNHEIAGRIRMHTFFADQRTDSDEPVSIYDRVKSMGIRAYRAKRGHALMCFDKLRLQGMEIRLAISANDLPSEYRMSFVFVCSDEYPLINGQLVFVLNREDCQIFSDKHINVADWFLMSPTIGLRYALEQWSDEFFSWVREFFIPGFHYWRYEDNPGWEEFHRRVAQTCGQGRKSRKEARDEIFGDLAIRFKEEVQEVLSRHSL